MGILKNKRHELFAQAYARGASQCDAYSAAGYAAATPKSATSAGGRLLARPDIAARVKELADKAAERVVLTRQWVIAEAVSLYLDARKNEARNTAARVLELLGREVLAFVDRKEIGLPGDFSEKSDADLRAIIRAARTAGNGSASGLGIEEAPDEEAVLAKSDLVH